MNNTRYKGWLLKGLAAGVLAASSPSFAQTANANEEETLEEIVVTGSRVAGRLAADSAVAIDVVTVDDLTKNGFTQLGQSLQTLAPSFNFSRTQISDGSDLFRPATLRGLQPDQTLVLINDNIRLALGGNNIFDETPNELDSNEVLDIITGGAARFPVRGVPYGFNGGTYYLRLSTDS